MTKDIDRVARSLADTDDYLGDATHGYGDLARAAILALIPPSDEMVEAGVAAGFLEGSEIDAGDIALIERILTAALRAAAGEKP